MNNRQKEHAYEYLANEGYSDLHIKPLSEEMRLFTEHVYQGNYPKRLMDFYNIFDGFVFDLTGHTYWVKMTSGRWPNRKKIDDFMKGKKNMMVIRLKVHKVKGKYTVSEWCSAY